MHVPYSFLRAEILLVPAFLVALFLWKKIEPEYRPFCVLLGLAVLSEAASYWSILWFHSNAVTTNIYGLLECTLIIYQFLRWNSFRGKIRWYYSLQVGSLVLWTLCNLVFFHIGDYDVPFYRIGYPFALVILSVNEINLMITHDNRNLYKNSRFVICLGFITFFLYQILYEGAFLVSEYDKNEVVSNKIISLFAYVNVFVNGLYFVAVLLIPRKRNTAFERIFDKIQDEI